MISNRTCDDEYAIWLQGELIDRGYTVFQQTTNRFSKDATNWKAIWMPFAERAVKIVCIVTQAYLESEPCAKEFSVAENLGKLMVVTTIPDMRSFKAMVCEIDTLEFPTAATPKMYILGGGQATTSSEDVPAAIVGVM